MNVCVCTVMYFFFREGVRDDHFWIFVYFLKNLVSTQQHTQAVSQAAEQSELTGAISMHDNVWANQKKENNNNNNNDSAKNGHNECIKCESVSTPV